MNVIAFVLLPFCLATSNGSVSQIEGKASDRTDRLESQTAGECSETLLEFTIGGVPHQTNSDHCLPQSDTDDQSRS